MIQVNSCCFCLSPRIGTVIIGILGMIMAFIGVFRPQLIGEEYTKINGKYLAGTMTVNCFSLVVHIALLLGVLLKVYWMFWPWLCFVLFNIIATISIWIIVTIVSVIYLNWINVGITLGISILVEVWLKR
jgi:hypothetical protein